MTFVTLAVRMMTLFIQRTNRRDTLACMPNRNAFLRVDMMPGQLTELDEQESEEVENHRKTKVRKATRREEDLLEKYG